MAGWRVGMWVGSTVEMTVCCWAEMTVLNWVGVLVEMMDVTLAVHLGRQLVGWRAISLEAQLVRNWYLRNSGKIEHRNIFLKTNPEF